MDGGIRVETLDAEPEASFARQIEGSEPDKECDQDPSIILSSVGMTLLRYTDTIKA